MSDDLTARLRQVVAGAKSVKSPGVFESQFDAIAARLAEVVRAHLVEHPAQDPYFDHLTTELALKERALKACQQYTDTIAGERDEAVRLLEKAVDIIDDQRAAFISDGAFGQVRAEIVELQEGLRARHKEAQGG